MDIRYRFAGKADAPTLLQLRMAYLYDDHGELSAAEEVQIRAQLEDYFPRAIEENLLAVLAFDGGEPVACACLVITEKPANPAFPTGKTGTILSVYTEPTYRRRGIATHMMKMLIEEGKKLNLSFIELSATVSGKPLYEKLGFREKKSAYTPMKLKL